MAVPLIDKHVAQLSVWCIEWMENVTITLENILESLIKLDIHTPYDTVPATSLGHLPKRNENTCAYKDISTHMFIIALFSCYL